MAASRKLQGEIDRCLKKVGEGVEQFEDIWKKVYNATNSNQKEKYEADLKKEIKKLQRLRDQIKSWLTSAEIKDKSQLLENRKLIETQMERFKVVERETKTKAYSKEGLGAAQNKDPAQKERDDINRWLSDSIDTLNIQIDQFESEIELLMAAGKKRKIDKEKTERIEELRKWVEKHRFHIKKLEILMRMLNNESIDCDMIKKIKDDIEYYLESSQDPDFVENDCIYDDIEMEDLDYSAPEITVGKAGKHLVGSHDSTEGSTPSSSVCGTSPTPSPAIPNNHSNDHNEVQGSQPTPTNNTSHNEKKRTTKTDDSRASRVNAQGSTPVKPQVVRPSNSTSSMNALTNHSNKSTAVPATPTKPVSGSTSQSTPNNSSSSSGLANHLISPSQLNRVDSSHASNSISHNSTNSHISNNHANPTSCGGGNAHANSNGPSSTLSTIVSSNNVGSNSNLPPPIGSSSQGFSSVSSTAHSSISTQSTKAIVGPSEQGVSLKSMAAKKLDEVSVAQRPIASNAPTVAISMSVSAATISASSAVSSVSQAPSMLSSTGGAVTATAAAPCRPAPEEITISPLLGVAPLGAVRLNQEHKLQYDRLQASFYHMPHPSDSERFRLHFPRQPCHTPEYYPQVSNVPPHLSDTVEFFQRLATETLFFIFYYMEGTKAQYLAAKALKKQSWRFHTKYMMWFQRHEEPKAITDEYEQGTYIFFDCESWGQRKRENFIFEYKYLEDRDLN